MTEGGGKVKVQREHEGKATENETNGWKISESKIERTREENMNNCWWICLRSGHMFDLQFITLWQSRPEIMIKLYSPKLSWSLLFLQIMPMQIQKQQ